jgi:hypothetical protein
MIWQAAIPVRVGRQQPSIPSSTAVAISNHLTSTWPPSQGPEETLMQAITVQEVLTFFFSVGVLLYLWLQ